MNNKMSHRRGLASSVIVTLVVPSFLVSFFIVPLYRVAAESIQLEREHGIYMVPVQVNRKMTVPFVLDSGASEVAIPQDVFLTLTRTGTVKDSDFVGTGTYVTADGSEHSSKRFILRELKGGDHVIADVIANVVSVNADPLLGQSFLSKLPSWAIDNDRHMLVLKDEPEDHSSEATGKIGIKYTVLFLGKCRYQLVRGFFPCDDKVIWAALQNGRMLLSFNADTMLFYLSGGKDRQPNLTNYYIGIDTLVMQKIPSMDTVRDPHMEGECHFLLNRDATKFFDVRCDVYDRSKGLVENFYLEGIRKFDRKVF